MGTNYYLRTDVCTHCNRERERIHIGKSSAGWPFLFRGYRRWPPDGVPHPLTSAYEWREFIASALTAGGRLIDEYGQDCSEPDLWSLIDGKKGLVPKASYTHGARESEWFDTDGFRFCDNEFS
jgi:hypothetical protein